MQCKLQIPAQLGQPFHGKKAPKEGGEKAPVSKTGNNFHLPYSGFGGFPVMGGLILAGG